MRIRFVVFAVVGTGLAMLGLAGGAVAESQKEKDAAFEAKALKEIELASAAAGALFDQANQARDREEHEVARDLYARVHELVPGSPHPVRRQAMEEMALDHRDRAVELARAAVALEASPEDLAALSFALVTGSGPEGVPETDRKEALDLARRAAGLNPNDYYVQAALAQAAIVNDDLALLEQAAARSVAVAPEEPGGYSFQAIAQVAQGHFGDAERSVETARQHGLSEAEYRSLLEAVRGSRPWYLRYGIPALEGLAVWAGCLLLLLVSGLVLSRATLRSATTLPVEANGRAAGSDLFLRRLYKGVLWLSCLYYWLSIPVVSLLVLVVGGGLIYGVFAMGYVPIKLVVIIVVLVGVTLVSIVKGLFARGRDEDPGLRLAPAEEPRLRDLLQEVAGRIGTRPVDNVYLTPGTELAVMERGGMLKQLRGASERCLILGIGVLEGLQIGPFKAILAHEYGHFSNQDTAGGGFALSVRRSLLTMARHLAEGGAAAWYNPAWLFVLGFNKVFLRVSQGASRLQEILADRWAAFTYGSKPFERGLLHVIERDIRFSAHANATLGEVVEGRRALANLYTYRPAAAPIPEEEIAAEVKKAIHREPSPYDSHPSPVKRFVWARALRSSCAASPEDEAEVWTLFQDREALERRLTQTVRENLLVQGIDLPDAEPVPAG